MESIDSCERKAMICQEYLFEVMELCEDLDFTVFNEFRLFIIVSAIESNISQEQLSKIVKEENTGRMYGILNQSETLPLKTLKIETREDGIELMSNYLEKYLKLINMGISEKLINYLQAKMIRRDKNRISNISIERMHEGCLELAIEYTEMRNKSKRKVKKVRYDKKI